MPSQIRSQTSRTRQKALLRQEIIDAARDILAREGYEQLSMRKVAERIEYSPTAIYLHFEDKADLVFQVREETFGRIVNELESLETEFKDPVARSRGHASLRRVWPPSSAALPRHIRRGASRAVSGRGGALQRSGVERHARSSASCARACGMCRCGEVQEGRRGGDHAGHLGRDATA